METITMNVKGMSCGGCVASVKRVLQAVPGVDDVDVTLSPGAATVTYDPQRTDAVKLRGAVEGAGYDVVA